MLAAESVTLHALHRMPKHGSENFAAETKSWAAMQKAAQIAKGSMLFESHVDVQHRNPKVQGAHHFVAPVEFDGKLWRVQLLVKDIVENRNDRAVVHTIDGIDIREMENPPGGVNLSEGGVSYVDGVAAAATDELADTESVPKDRTFSLSELAGGRVPYVRVGRVWEELPALPDN